MSAAAFPHLRTLELRSRSVASFSRAGAALWPLLLIGADLLSLTIAALLAYGLIAPAPALRTAMFDVAVMLASIFGGGLYRVGVSDPVTELRKLFWSISLASIPLVCSRLAFNYGGPLFPGMLWAGLAFPFAAAFRSYLRVFLIRSGVGLTPAVIIGTGANAARLRELLGKHKHLGIRPIAIPDHCDATPGIDSRCGCALMFRADSVAALGNAETLQTTNFAPPRLGLQVKRVMDLALALVLSILLSPLLLLICVVVRLSSKGPVLYGHTRVGENGRLFTAWKFRSMVVDGEGMLKAHLASDPGASREWELTQKLKDDPRVLPIGGWLRKTSLDELPQLWNVIRGEMSLVGPWLVTREEIPRYGHTFRLYKSVRPGLTGLWQVSGRSKTSYAERVCLDEHYLTNGTVWLDLHILIRTIPTLLFGEGAC